MAYLPAHRGGVCVNGSVLHSKRRWCERDDVNARIRPPANALPRIATTARVDGTRRTRARRGSGTLARLRRGTYYARTENGVGPSPVTAGGSSAIAESRALLHPASSPEDARRSRRPGAGRRRPASRRPVADGARDTTALRCDDDDDDEDRATATDAAVVRVKMRRARATTGRAAVQ